MDRSEKRDLQQLNRRVVLSVFDWVGTLVTALIVLSVMFSFFFRIVGVDGDSMLPSYKDGDMLLLDANEDTYRRGNVVVVDRYSDPPLIKRVIAVGGDTLTIDDDGVVTVNGKVLKEKYIRGKTVLNNFDGEVTVPHGYLFVMGDNRSISKDSRSDEIGLISEKDVVGRVIRRVWPLR